MDLAMASALTTVFAPLVGSVLASGVVASVVTVALNAREQRRETLRARLEETYAAAHDYCTLVTTHYVKYAEVFKGRISINDANDMTIAAAAKTDGTVYRRLEMLVEIYVPKARSALRQAISVREELAGIYQDYRARYPHGDPIALDLLPRLQAAFNRLEEVEREFKEAIVHAARRL
jgi:hypothetical protein